MGVNAKSITEMKSVRCSSNSCIERHPSFCRYFKLNGICKFGQGCAYVYVKMVKTYKVNVLTKDIKNMNAEMDFLKSTVNVLVDIKKEGKVIKKTSRKLKCKIIVGDKIRLLEEEFDDSDTDESCEDESIALQFKCSKCNYRCERDHTLSKHINTKHSEAQHNKRKHEKKKNRKASDKSHSDREN